MPRARQDPPDLESGHPDPIIPDVVHCDVTRPRCFCCVKLTHRHKGWWQCITPGCRMEGVGVRELRPDENPDPQGRP